MTAAIASRMRSALLAACVAFVAAVACTDPSTETPLTDGGIDAPDVPATRAELHRIRRGAPVPATLVQFHGADGRFFTTAMTDDNGRATGPIEPGGSISFLGGSGTLVTIAGLSPDEVITYDETPELAQRIVGTIQLMFDGAPPNATRYDVTCGGQRGATQPIATGPFSFTITDGCLDADGTIDVVATALDGAGVPSAFTVLSNLVPPSGTDTGVTMMPPWVLGFTGLRVRLTGAPTTATEMGISVMPTDGLQIYSYVSTARWYVNITAGAASLTHLVAPFTSEVIVWTQVLHAFDDREARQNLVRRGSYSSLADVEVPATSFLPLITSGELVDGRLTWTLAQAPDSADTMMIELFHGNVQWRVFAPPDATSLALPELRAPLVTPAAPELQSFVLEDDADSTWTERRLAPYVPDPLPAHTYRTSVFL